VILIPDIVDEKARLPVVVVDDHVDVAIIVYVSEGGAPTHV
jgi:hypothetical protein